MRFDTIVGMAVSNIVAIAIMIGTAATLHVQHLTTIETASDAARALRPIAGHFAFLLFSLGIIGTGLLAVPVLAGSAAYAVSNIRGWNASLESNPVHAVGFYAVITLSTLVGIAIDWSSLNPMRALFWSAVINGVAAVPILIGLMIAVSRRGIMGRFVAPISLKIFGWLAAVVMGVASIVMIALPG